MVRAAPAPFPERGFLLGRLSNAGLTVPRPAPRKRPASETLHHGGHERYAKWARPLDIEVDLLGLQELHDFGQWRTHVRISEDIYRICCCTFTRCPPPDRDQLDPSRSSWSLPES